MTVSIELFPARNPAGRERLEALLKTLPRFAINGLSVTEGALASEAQGSVETIDQAQRLTGLPITSHLVAWGKCEAELDWQLDALSARGVRSILALRGDKRANSSGPIQRGDQLVAYLARKAPGFRVGVAAYPEGHPEDRDFQQTLDVLAAKADAGARFAVTQFSFDMAALERLREGLAKRGIALPLHIGVLPIRDLEAAQRLADRCGAALPSWVSTWVRTWEMESGQAWNDQGAAALGLDWCQQLRIRGFEHLHLYALNQPEPTVSLLRGLGLQRDWGQTAALFRPSRSDLASAPAGL